MVLCGYLRMTRDRYIQNRRAGPLRPALRHPCSYGYRVPNWPRQPHYPDTARRRFRGLIRCSGSRSQRNEADLRNGSDYYKTSRNS